MSRGLDVECDTLFCSLEAQLTLSLAALHETDGLFFRLRKGNQTSGVRKCFTTWYKKALLQCPAIMLSPGNQVDKCFQEHWSSVQLCTSSTTGEMISLVLAIPLRFYEYIQGGRQHTPLCTSSFAEAQDGRQRRGETGSHDGG